MHGLQFHNTFKSAQKPYIYKKKKKPLSVYIKHNFVSITIMPSGM